MYEAAARGLSAKAPETRVVEISGAAFADLLPWKSYRSVSTFDVCKDGWQSQVTDADLIVLDQVLEHVEDPGAALANVFSALPVGGRVFVSTPFLIKYHGAPQDHWRWTSSGLGLMLERAGFKEVGSASWGSRACAIANFSRWVVYNPQEHSLVDEPNFPVTVWAWGTK